MIYDYDFASKIIDVPMGTTTVLVRDLLSDVRDAEATTQGIVYGQIASASGAESLGPGVSVGITVNLLDDWQIRFATGNYIAKIAGGNLVGGLNGDPVAYSSGVQVLLLQSAASTVVTTSTGSGLSIEQDATLTATLQAAQAANTQATKGRKMQTNKAIISGDGLSVSIYEDDGTALLHTFSISADKNTRTPV
jgi:hypothetical protein